MTKKSRYLFLGLWVGIFIILAPFLALYIQGKKFDNDTNKLIGTGVISIQTEPDGASVWIDEKPIGTSPLNYRFALPGSHHIRIQKTGYRIWEKSVTVRENTVSYINQQDQPAHLLKEAPPITIAQEILDWELQNDNLVLLKAGKLELRDEKSTLKNEITIPKEIKQIQANQNNQSLLLFSNSDTWILDPKEPQSLQKIAELSKKTVQIIEFNTKDTTVLEEGTLKKISFQTKQTTELAKNILAAATNGDNIYALSDKTNGNDLLISTANGKMENLIIDLPKFATPLLQITKDKQIFILSNQKVYSLGGNLNQIANGVIKISTTETGAVLSSDTEIFYYQPPKDQALLITRNRDQIFNSLVLPKISYAFFTNSQGVWATELSNSDIKNTYELAQTQNAIKLNTDANNKWLYWLDTTSHELKKIQLEK